MTDGLRSRSILALTSLASSAQNVDAVSTKGLVVMFQAKHCGDTADPHHVPCKSLKLGHESRTEPMCLHPPKSYTDHSRMQRGRQDCLHQELLRTDEDGVTIGKRHKSIGSSRDPGNDDHDSDSDSDDDDDD